MAAHRGHLGFPARGPTVITAARCKYCATQQLYSGVQTMRWDGGG